MSDIAIQVQGLGKQYFLGAEQNRFRKTLRESISEAVRSPFRRGQPDEKKNSFWALKDVEFKIKQGDVVGIIGRNGAGKSTLLKILSRITDPTEGEIEINGRVGSLLEVGTGFHHELTGRENVFLNGAILGMKRADIARKFDEIVAFAGTEKFLDTPVKFYSSGMYMRLAFAVAAHLEPEILIVDEVLAVGDSEFQEKCLGKMNAVARDGRTVIFVSHNMNAVEQLCNSVLVLKQGKVVEQSKEVRTVIRNYMFGETEEPTMWVNSESRFDNPHFKPVRFFIGDEAGNLLNSFQPADAEVWLHVEAEIQVIDAALTFGYAIYSGDGNSLYWSYQKDSHPDQWPTLGTGLVKLKSAIPPRFLNAGRYRIELIAGLTNRMWLLEPHANAPAVFLNVQGGLSDSPLYTVPRPTLLAPILNWIACI